MYNATINLDESVYENHIIANELIFMLFFEQH